MRAGNPRSSQNEMTTNELVGQQPAVDGWQPAKRGRRRAPITLVLGIVLVGIVVLLALVSLFWTPYDPGALSIPDRFLPIGSPGYLLGTTRLGRDVLTQIMAGAKTSLLVSILSTSVAVLVGATWGLAAAGAGPRTQRLLTQAADVGVALPGILIALVVATAIGAGNTAAVIAIIGWFVPIVARVTIGPAKQILALDYVEAAFAYGRTKRYILRRHVLPNIAPVLIVQASLMFAAAILIEATLSFLGVGAQPPTASWGRMLNESQTVLDFAPSLMVIPGLAIMGAVLGFNLLGDGLRTVLDPKQSANRGAP